MARTAIALLGTPIVDESRTASEAVTPGHVVEMTSGSQYKKQTDDAANVAAAFALEVDMSGNDVDDAYAADDRIRVGYFTPGSVVYAWLASGHNVAIGDYLTTSTAAGLLAKTGVAAGVRIACAEEAVDTSGSAPVAGTRIRVRIV